jgi:hypothetical protein
MAKNVVAAQAQLGAGFIGQAVADFAQLLDEIVDRHMVGDIDEFLDASTH